MHGVSLSVACLIKVYLGTCANGQLIAQADRREDNHCGSCEDTKGYKLVGRTCEVSLELCVP